MAITILTGLRQHSRSRRAAFPVTALASLLVIASGCAPRVRPTTVPSPPARFIATAYCTGIVTASGAKVDDGVVAADPSVLPLGTVIRVSGVARRYNRVYRVLDTGRRVRGNRIDIYVRNCHEATAFGRQSATVTVVRKAPVLTR